MSQEHRYGLEKYAGHSSRYHCPECADSEKTFSRYIDKETGEHLADHVGKCDRLNNCGYHYTPKQFFADNPDHSKGTHSISGNVPNRPFKRPTPPPPTYVPTELLKASLQPQKPIKDIGGSNTLIAFLIDTFGEATAAKLAARYFIGTSKYWHGATVFWQIDAAGRIRAGKIIQYLTAAASRESPTFTGKNCKRNKSNTLPTQWVHKAAKLEGFNLSQCLFGEHLLNREPYKPVGLVESEKTAILASVYLPDFVWVACGGLEQLSAGRCKALAGRSVTLFPDLKGLERWEAKCRELATFCECRVSDLLERKASEADRAAGLDLADFLLRNAPPTAAPAAPFPEIPTPANPSPIAAPRTKEPVLHPLTKGWRQELDELEAFFSGFDIPDHFARLEDCETIPNPAKYIPAAIALIRQHHGNRIYGYHLDRLKRLRDKFTTAEV